MAVVLAEISVDRFEPVFTHDPARAVNVGIMEQTMVGVAAGYALEGFHPVIHTIAPSWPSARSSSSSSTSATSSWACS